MKKLTIILFCILLTAAACKKNNEVTEVQQRITCELMKNNNLNSSLINFALESFKSMEEDTTESVNIFYSPFSLSVVSTMLLNGSKDETESIMKNALHYQDIEMPTINTYLNDITNCMAGHDDINIRLANSLWIHNDFPVHEAYKDSLKKYYESNVYNEDFRDPLFIDILNTWVEDKTDGKITDLFLEGDISPIDVLILINAVYFSGNWTYAFNPENTIDSAFTIYNGTDIETPYMQCNGLEYLYYNDTDFNAVRMPYGNESAAFYVFLPNEDSDLDNFFDQLNEDNWNNWINSFDSISTFISESDLSKTWFQIPKFNIEYVTYLIDLMKNLGMEIVFDDPDFSGITDMPIFITNIKQKSLIEINETGSVAAAATFYEGGFGGLPPRFLINRPFFFVIRDENSGVILFMGKVVNP